jgi:hypothetical protein
MMSFKTFLPLMIAGLTTFSVATVWAADYEYDVSGYGDTGPVYGEIDADRGSRDVEGYIYTEDGRELYFEGEWSGYGEIEGYDELGNYVELEID